MQDILADYRITPEDIENIKSVSSLMAGKIDELSDLHYSVLLNNKKTASFISNEEVLERARNAFIDWFHDLVSGNYTPAYLLKLNRIGKTHVKIGLPAEYVNVQMALIRDFVADQILKEIGDDRERTARVISSLNKALDMNLDIMTRSYRVAEMSSHFVSNRIDNMIISNTRRLVTGFNLALMIGLLVIGVATVVLSVYEFTHLLKGDLGRGVLSALGTLLILWVIIELLDTQTRHMRGHQFAIKVFVSVALVAELRRVLITSIEHGSWQNEASLAGSILVLGLVFWMVSASERR